MIITREMGKEHLVMYNVKNFATFRSNELEIHTALDLESTVLNGGEE